ncbi:MAG: Tn3 family transposase [Nitrospiria bacterium]
MSQIQILSNAEAKSFDSPPDLSKEEQQKVFHLSAETKQIVENIRTPVNKVGFVLQLGYMKYANRFYNLKTFKSNDISFVAKSLEVDVTDIHLAQYKLNSYIRHRRAILNILGIQAFDEKTKINFRNEIKRQISQQIRPKQIIQNLVESLQRQKTEVPAYNTFSDMITDELNCVEKNLLSTIKKQLTNQQKTLLDGLLDPVSNQSGSSTGDSDRYQRPRVTLMKTISQSTRPAKIKQSVQDFSEIKGIFNQLKKATDALGLSQESMKYYAIWVKKAQTFQIAQFPNRLKRYLHLMAFISHQYRLRQDTLVEILLISVQSVLNEAAKRQKELDFRNRKEKNQTIQLLSKDRFAIKSTLDEIKVIIRSISMSDTEKVHQISDLLGPDAINKNEDQEDLFDRLEKEVNQSLKDEDYLDLLEVLSIKLQNRVSDIIKQIEFNPTISNKSLLSAIQYFKDNDGNVKKNAPLEFLEQAEVDILLDHSGQLRVSLYKALLFTKTASAIKSGDLNLIHSYKFLSIDEYLINKERWRKQKDDFMKRAELEGNAVFDSVINLLKTAVDDHYHRVNQNIQTGKNSYVTFRKDGKFKLKTPKVDKIDTEKTSELLADSQYVSVLKILKDTNEVTNFIGSLKHHSIKNNKRSPSPEIFHAGILAHGCDIGVNKIAIISKGVSEGVIENTVNWYFSVDGVNMANNRVGNFINKLAIPNLYRKSQDLLHTSSDGQKFGISVDSLNANYSFKYFGHKKGVSVHSFIDERNNFFYSTVISSSEREAAYVIDGLLHNEEIKSNIHSTDTHGFTESIFGATYLLTTTFAPRIKKIKDQTLYSFKPRKEYEVHGYKILPDRYINVELIRENWDDILRLIATIRLGESTASQIFKRLSSYSKQNPLYRALKEFGRIIKTIFILKYIDDVELRQTIQKQLNNVELYNKFSKAVFFANNQEFRQGTKEEQEMIIGCRRLIQNSIILWNYLYLSQKLATCEDPVRREEMLTIIKNGSVITWRHINLHGEYDFTPIPDQKGSQFDLSKILSLKVA